MVFIIFFLAKNIINGNIGDPRRGAKVAPFQPTSAARGAPTLAKRITRALTPLRLWFNYNKHFAICQLHFRFLHCIFGYFFLFFSFLGDEKNSHFPQKKMNKNPKKSVYFTFLLQERLYAKYHIYK